MELVDLVSFSFPCWVPVCDSHNLLLLDLFLSSGSSLCSAAAFLLLGNIDRVALVSIDLPFTSKEYAPFHRTIFYYSCADLDGFCYHNGDVWWEDTCIDGALDCLWLGPDWNYCIYPSSKVTGPASFISMVFSYLYNCCCSSVCLYVQDRSAVLRPSSDFIGKDFLSLPFLLTLVKQGKLSLPTKLALVTFAKLLIVLSITTSAPRDIEILGWCPAGSVLPHGEKVPLSPGWLPF